MSNQMKPEAFAYILSTVNSLVNACHSIAASDADEDGLALGTVPHAFDGEGKKLWETTKLWLRMLDAASDTVAKDFCKEYGIKL